METLLRILLGDDGLAGWRVAGRPTATALAAGSVGLALLVALAGLAALGWHAYRGRPAWVGPGRRRLLAGLRVAGIAVALLMAVGSALPLQRDAAPSGRVVVLVDRSASAAGADLDALARADGPLARLDGRFRVEWHAYGDGAAQACAGPSALPAADAAASAPGSALRGLAGTDLAAVLLVGDGGWNRGEDPREAVAALGAPVHALHLAATPTPRVAALALDVDEPVAAGAPARVRLRLRAEGVTGRTLGVALLAGDGRRLDRREVAVAADGEIDVPLTLPAHDAGDIDLAALVEPVDGDGHDDDRCAASGVAVRALRERVLVVEDRPRWWWRGLAEVLAARADRFEPAQLLLSRGRDLSAPRGTSWVESAPADAAAWSGLAVVVLGDVGPAALGADGARLLARWVREQGGSLVVVAGPAAMPEAWAGTPLASVLPVVPAAAPEAQDASDDGWRLRQPPAPDGWELIDAGSLAQAAPWTWLRRDRQARPGAATLVEGVGGAGVQPLMRAQRVGRGRCVWIAGDETWRLRLGAGGESAHRRFWEDLLGRLAQSRRTAGARAVLDAAAQAVVGAPLTLRARLRDADGRPRAAEAVEVAVAGPDGARALRLAALPGRPGEFAGELTPGAAGEHRLRLEQVGAAERRDLRVWALPARRDPAGAVDGAELWREVAALGGGRSGGPAELPQLVDAIAAAPEAPPERRMLELWASPALALLLALLLGIEWGLRRRADLP